VHPFDPDDQVREVGESASHRELRNVVTVRPWIGAMRMRVLSDRLERVHTSLGLAVPLREASIDGTEFDQ
jgi:hypothetical protein